MAKIDLARYTLGELKGLQHDVERAIKDRQQQEVQRAREQILAIAKEASVCVEDMLGNPGKKPKKKDGKKVEPSIKTLTTRPRLGPVAVASESGWQKRWQTGGNRRLSDAIRLRSLDSAA